MNIFSLITYQNSGCCLAGDYNSSVMELKEEARRVIQAEYPAVLALRPLHPGAAAGLKGIADKSKPAKQQRGLPIMFRNLFALRGQAGRRIGRKALGGLCGMTLAVALACAAAPSALADGGNYEVAFQGSNGDLWTTGSGGTGDTGLAMMSG